MNVLKNECKAFRYKYYRELNRQVTHRVIERKIDLKATPVGTLLILIAFDGDLLID